MRLIRCWPSNRPRPAPSPPQFLDATLRSATACAGVASVLSTQFSSVGADLPSSASVWCAMANAPS